MRKNDASRWVANDIIRKGNQYNSYSQSQPNIGNHRSSIDNPNNFAKIPPHISHNLNADELKIQKMK